MDGNKTAKSEIISCSRSALLCGRELGLVCSVERKEGKRSADKQAGIEQRGARLSDELKNWPTVRETDRWACWMTAELSQYGPP